MYHHILLISPPERVGECKATVDSSGFFFAWFMNLILDLLGSLNEGKMQNQCFQPFSRSLVK
jgi:hypothetical protein